LFSLHPHPNFIVSLTGSQHLAVCKCGSHCWWLTVLKVVWESSHWKCFCLTLSLLHVCTTFSQSTKGSAIICSSMWISCVHFQPCLQG
jgi:hypothetical protein